MGAKVIFNTNIWGCLILSSLSDNNFFVWFWIVLALINLVMLLISYKKKL